MHRPILRQYCGSCISLALGRNPTRAEDGVSRRVNRYEHRTAASITAISCVMLNDLGQLVLDFFASTAGDIFPNEANLQHRLALYLTKTLPHGSQLIFEWPVHGILPNAPRLVKKEIDLVVRSPDTNETFAIELKCPRQGQYPEQMFKLCQDLQFLEQLVEHGCDGGVFAMHVVDPLFYSSGSKAGIYAHFRGGVPLTGRVQKPTGARDEEARLSGTYVPTWSECGGSGRYWVQVVTEIPESVTLAAATARAEAAWSRMAAKVVNSRRFGEMPDKIRERLRGALIKARDRASLSAAAAKLVNECLGDGGGD
jgi:hypothetical protein